MKERLKELLRGKSIDQEVDVEYVADFLLSEGVIVPPCKVGDKAYHLTNLEELELAEIFEGKVCSISKEEKSLWIYARYDNGLNYWYTEREIGRNLFFTREEAEKALAERSENGK
jgi:hypothetical protein